MSSWFYKLRRKRSAASQQAAMASQNQKPAAPPSPKTAAPPCSPNRASYYFPSRSRDRVALSPGSPAKLRDTRFPPLSPQPGDIVFDVVARRDARFGVDDEMMHELKLRPILTKPAAKTEGGEASDSTASPTARLRQRRLHTRRAPSGNRRKAVTGLPAETCSRLRRVSKSKLRWLYDESVVLVKESAEPEEDFLVSMREMIVANHHDVLSSPRSLEDLLACYLALNAAEHHRAIVAAFRRAWLDSVLPPAPQPRERCRLHARCT